MRANEITVQPVREKDATGHYSWSVTLPIQQAPQPLVYGSGKTAEEAVEDLNYRIAKDGFGDIYKAVL